MKDNERVAGHAGWRDPARGRRAVEHAWPANRRCLRGSCGGDEDAQQARQNAYSHLSHRVHGLKMSVTLEWGLCRARRTRDTFRTIVPSYALIRNAPTTTSR